MLTETGMETRTAYCMEESGKTSAALQVCNELGLLLEVEVALLQQLGIVAGTCGEEQSTAAGRGARENRR